MRKVALVTGGSGGIGYAISSELAKHGFDIIIVNDKTESVGHERAKQIRETYSVGCEYHQCDISVEEQIEKLFMAIQTDHGKLDVLINNAGITADAMLHKMSLEQWNTALNVNLTGTFLCTRAAVKMMKERKAGKILNVTSISAQMGNIGQANYAAAKGGIISFTKTVAKETARYGILVNAIAPGFINTRMTRAMPENILEKMIAQIPLGRIGEPEEVAKLAYFLVSDDNTYITGQVINQNGGMYV